MKLKLQILFCVFLALIQNMAYPIETDSTLMNDKREQQKNVIKSLLLNKDFNKNDFDIEIEKLDTLCENDVNLYIYSIKSIFDHLIRSYKGNDISKSQAIESLVRILVLKKASAPNACGIQIEVLTTYLKFDNINKLNLEDRKEVTIKLLEMWRSIIVCTEEEWNPNNPKHILKPYFPPASYQGGFYSGMSPDSIDDEKVRKEYAEFLEERENLAKKSMDHSQAKHAKRRYEADVKKYIIDLYNRPPFDFQEIKTLLEDYKIDEQFTKDILSKVKKS